MHVSRPRVAVVGHVEWVQFAHVPHVPLAGEVIHAHDAFEEPAGGGAVAAVQLARLAGESIFMTALGDDELGARSVRRLHELGVDVQAVRRPVGTRRAVTLVDEIDERTIITLGPRLEPHGPSLDSQGPRLEPHGPRLEPQGQDDQLPWEALGEMDAVYFTAGDLGALRAARAARVLVASPRAGAALGQGVELDALVLSEEDEIERRQAEHAQGDAKLVVFTEGARGGAYRERSGRSGTWAAAPLPAAAMDAYGCGDSFAAGLTYGLGAGLEVPDALALAARCGAICLTGSGPYEHQLTEADL
jgi:ribokinase